MKYNMLSTRIFIQIMLKWTPVQREREREREREERERERDEREREREREHPDIHTRYTLTLTECDVSYTVSFDTRGGKKGTTGLCIVLLILTTRSKARGIRRANPIQTHK